MYECVPTSYEQLVEVRYFDLYSLIDRQLLWTLMRVVSSGCKNDATVGVLWYL